MEHSVETVSPVQRKITVSVPAADVDRAIDKAVRRFGADLILPGFRKGKVPAKVLEKRFGNEIYARATDTLVNEAIAEILDKENYQGVAVVNYTDRETPFTRIIEHKHFEFGTQPKTVITREYPADWQEGMEPYYPVNDEKNQKLYEKYAQLAAKEARVIFGGRLAEYKYYDMDKVIESALLRAGGLQ